MHRLIMLGVILAAAPVALGSAPQYTITNIGTVDPGDFASQGYGISPGGIAFGRSAGSSTVAFTWTSGTGNHDSFYRKHPASQNKPYY